MDPLYNMFLHISKMNESTINQWNGRTDGSKTKQKWADILGGMPTAASSFGTGHSYAGFMERLYKKYPPSKS